MEILARIPASAVLWLSAALAFCAVMAYRARRHHTAFCFILCLGILLRFFASTDSFLHLWDEAFHAVVAKNCITQPLRPTLYAHPALAYDYRNWLANHVWLHKPPLTLWVIAGSLRLFGINEIALRLPSLLASSLVIFLAYRIGTMLWSRPHGLLASALCAVNYHLIDLSSGRDATDHVDTLLVSTVSLAAFVILKTGPPKRTLVCDAIVGLCVGFAYLTKGLPGLFPLGLWLVWAISDRTQFSPLRLTQRFLVVIGTAVVVGAPWSIYAHVHYPRESAWEQAYSLRHVFEVLEGHDHPWYYFIGRMEGWLGPVSYIAVCYAILRLFWRKHDPRKLIFILAWFLTPHGVFSLVATKMPAYATMSAVAGFLIISIFILDMRSLIVAKCHPKALPKTIFCGLLLLLLCLPLKRTLKRLHLIRDYERSPVWAQDLRDLATTHPGTNTVVFAVPHAIEAMFYGDFAAYNYLPSREELKGVVSSGRDVVVFNQGQLPGWVTEMDGVQVYTPPRKKQGSQQAESTVPSKSAPGDIGVNLTK